jgi:membrane protease YdiL (CAAX protease family)
MMKQLSRDIISTSAEHEIRPPRRSSVAGAVIICADIALLCTVMLLPHMAGLWAAVAAAIMAVCAIAARAVQAVHLSLFCLFWVALPILFPAFRAWPLNIAIPLAVYGLTVAALSPLRRSLGWLRRGRIGPDIFMLVLATAVVSGIALVIWYMAASPDNRQILRNMPRMPLWAFPFAALVFALGNAALEEAIFRGIIMDALDSAFGPESAAMMLQAATFAAMHFVAGFPRGWWGLAMVFVYGLMLGMLRRRSRGMLAPWLAHVASDCTIFGILVWIVLRS